MTEQEHGSSNPDGSASWPAPAPAASWPGGPAAAPPDLDRSWAAWADAAERAGEPALALRLLETGGDPPAGRRAENLVILGHAQEAADLLQAAGITPAAGRRPRTYEELVLGATHAALGDQAAWRWYQAALPQVPQGLRDGCRDLTRAVADLIGDVAIADGEAQLLVDQHGSGNPATWVRASLGEVSGRRRDSAPVSVATFFLQAAQSAGRVGSRVLTDPRYLDGEVESRYLVALARSLVARGDVAAARLLVEAFALLHGRDEGLSAVRREVEPRRGWRLVAGSALVLLGFVAAAVVHRVLDNLVAVGGVGGVLVVLGLEVALARPGLSPVEKKAWHLMHGMRINRAAHTFAPGGVGRRFWTALGVLTGAAVAGVVVMSYGGRLVRALALPVTGGQLVAASFAAVPLAAVMIALLVRVVLARRDRAVARASFAAVVHDVRGSVAHCRCADVSWLSRGQAAVYAREHLRPEPDRTAAARVADRLAPMVRPGFASGDLVQAELMRCPQTDLAWVVGPLGDGGIVLALRGAGPVERVAATEQSSDGATGPFPGLYL